MSGDYDHVDQTRALQALPHIIAANHIKLSNWGPRMLIKVIAAEDPLVDEVSGYVTLLPAVSGKTPEEVETILGLRKGQLWKGMNVYQLKAVPTQKQFLPRGYTTLVAGLALREELEKDQAGYRRGYGAYQIDLIAKIPAMHLAYVAPGEKFSPGIAPSLRHLYP